MIIPFYKMTGAGNDFVMVDNRDLALSHILTRENIARLCNRRFGIGADGLIAIEPPQIKADVRMRYYNADGGEAEMCGNGARCFTAFVCHLSGGKTTTLCFETKAGVVQGQVNRDGSVTIRLTEPNNLKLNIMQAGNIIPAPIHFLNTGVPHAVVFLPDVEKIDLNKMGAYLRYHHTFAPAGTNADFVTVLSEHHLRLRTYERGVEGETLACGTGITASALLHAALTGATSPIRVECAGGDTLTVAYTRVGESSFSDVTLTGPATLVFRGEISVPST